ncbi:hypothetical protein SeLEV6574_g05324 [Synchytrium endobioticum]|uniref:Uncharacterized protein n=1 Tax=Synchytrium endobioticum TaxID=286115 RepID=A0A507CV21_9FUNG|nr:hypothetical protein SeLEV6574_g05324 [Synchytrium endobioticum]
MDNTYTTAITNAKAATAEADTVTTDAMTSTPTAPATPAASNHNDEKMGTSSKSLDKSAMGDKTKTSLSGSDLVHRVKSVLGLAADPASLSRPKQVPSSQSSSQPSLQEAEILSVSVETDLPPTI